MIFALVTKAINVKNLFIGLSLALFLIATRPVSAQALNDSVLIYQVQTGSVNSASEEFVSIYNNSAEPIEITGWCVEYASASNLTKTRLTCLDPPDGQTQLWLSGYSTALFASDEFMLANPDIVIDSAFKSGMATSSGHIKLLNRQQQSVDVVGWGAASSPEGVAAKAHATGNILQRAHSNDQELLNTDNNLTDFYQANFEHIPSGLYEVYIEPEPASTNLIITEILPDAIGADSGKEFIELYNSSQSEISLAGYMLQVGPDFTKTYTLPAINIAPEEHLALTDEQTKITLPNTSGLVRLLDPFGNILNTSEAYEKPGEGVSLALFASGWALTYEPTPGLKNVLLAQKPCPEGQKRSLETGRCRNAVSRSTAPKPCRSDQVRNPKTNRCRKVSSLTNGLKPCKPGQIRNIETNRCRSAIGKIKAKVPCKPNQVRNPATGRCKKISSASVKKPCKPGQARNAQTGRCRKVPPPINKNAVKDIESPLVTNNFKWWLAGASAAGSVGYGAYEWRRELLQVLTALKIKFMG